jgi:hypothetical protein
MSQKSERLRKLEIELHDLEEWLKLGLVPKKDVEKHKEEIKLLGDRIEEEKQRLRLLKESGELEDFTLPKKQNARQAYQEPHSLPEMDIGDEGMSDGGFDMETESFDMESTMGGDEGGEGEEDDFQHEEEEEDPYSDRNRWRRGVLEDPDENNW